jgi:hypothetical protein
MDGEEKRKLLAKKDRHLNAGEKITILEREKINYGEMDKMSI